MQLPDISDKRDYYSRWTESGVINGETDPDEWQQKLIDLHKQAEDAGLFYVADVYKYIRERADFVPQEWWDLQYSLTPVEHGVMGMEIYMAGQYIQEENRRKRNQEALKSVWVGKEYGSMSVNRKRVNKCVVKAIKDNIVTFTGVTGRYSCEFWTAAENIPSMLAQAHAKGWRKQI